MAKEQGRRLTKKNKSIAFIDISESVGIFEKMGDLDASWLLHSTIDIIVHHLEERGGRLIKLLGDGAMFMFDSPDSAIKACLGMHEILVGIKMSARPNMQTTDRIAVRVGVDFGSVVEFDNDVYGDIINVAARILPMARPDELMMTKSVYRSLSLNYQQKCIRVGRVPIRGKNTPEVVYGLNLDRRNEHDSEAHTIAQETFFRTTERWGGKEDTKTYISLIYKGEKTIFSNDNLPIFIGRSFESDLQIEDARVSRSHIRIDWVTGQFFLTDISANGTMVQYGGGTSDGGPQPIIMRRQRCTLVKSGFIVLGLVDRERLFLKDNPKEHPVIYFNVIEKEQN